MCPLCKFKYSYISETISAETEEQCLAGYNIMGMILKRLLHLQMWNIIICCIYDIVPSHTLEQ